MSDEVQKQLAAWIDANVIAEHILEELEDEDVEPTLENGQQLWLNVLLTELCYALRNSIKAIFNEGDDGQLPESIGDDGSIAK